MVAAVSKKQQNSGKRKIKRNTFQSVTSKIKRNILNKKPTNINDAVKLAIKSTKKINGKISEPRIIKIPKQGGILPLIPIFAGLSALGALSGGAAGIIKAVNEARSAKQQLKENERHNKTMESIAMGKGLYLKPYKTGLGLFLKKGLTLKKSR